MGMFAFIAVDLISRSRGIFRGNAAQVAMRPIVAGYQLRVNQDLIKRMLGRPSVGNEDPSFHGEFNPTSSYLTAEHNGQALRVTITRDGEIPIFAFGPGVDWLQQCAPPAGKAIMLLTMSLPDTR
jgi:hypothetical protein